MNIKRSGFHPAVQTQGASPRLSHDPATKTYAARRRTEGKTTKEIRRCLKPTSPDKSSKPSTTPLTTHRSVYNSAKPRAQPAWVGER